LDTTDALNDRKDWGGPIDAQSLLLAASGRVFRLLSHRPKAHHSALRINRDAEVAKEALPQKSPDRWGRSR